MKEKKYKISAPMGSTIEPKGPVTEKELRQFAIQTIHEPSQLEVWKEKIEKDPIEQVIEWMAQVGYSIKVIH